MSPEIHRRTVAVVGAAGKIGQITVAHAARAGYSVVAVARSPQRIPAIIASLPGVRTFAGDIMSIDDMRHAVAGIDAVVCTFGAPLTLDTIRTPPTVCEIGTRNIIQAMHERGGTRLICLSAIGVGDSRGRGRWLFRNVIEPVLLRRIFVDRHRQEELIRGSELAWTIVRPAELTDGPLAPVRVVDASDFASPEPTIISRASVASFLVQQISDDRALKRSPIITS